LPDDGLRFGFEWIESHPLNLATAVSTTTTSCHIRGRDGDRGILFKQASWTWDLIIRWCLCKRRATPWRVR